MRKINIGIIGLGTIGEGLFKIINSERLSIRKKFNVEINIIKVCDLDYKLAKKLKIELENLGSIVYLLKADLNNLGQTQKVISYAHKKMKGLDCLINNASIFENDNLINFSEKSFLSSYCFSSSLLKIIIFFGL